MKAYIKKLTVFVMIAAVTMFIAVAIASADDHHWKNTIHGKYAFTGSGNCVGSTTGFDENYNPKGDNVFAVMQIWEGDYIFDGHRTGSIKATFRGVDLSTYGISVANVSWKFKYEMTDHNRFQTYLPDEPGYYDTVEDPAGIHPPNYFNIVGRCDGAVEGDGTLIKITCGPPQKHIFCFPNPQTGFCDNTPVELFCSESHVGIRVFDSP